MEEKIQENTFSDKSTTDKSDTSEQPSEDSAEPSAISYSDNKQISDALIEEDLARLSTECKSLQDLVQKLEEANANLQVLFDYLSIGILGIDFLFLG